VFADCECGYSVNASTVAHHQVFTDLLETNFLTVQKATFIPGWKIEQYKIAASPGGGYGRTAQVGNVISNPVKNNASLSSPSVLGVDPGLQLYVRGGIPASGYVPVAEIMSSRNDMLFGSFRASMKLPSVNGTCGTFFWVRTSIKRVLCSQSDLHQIVTLLTCLTVV
jgi:hypothetical protein